VYVLVKYLHWAKFTNLRLQAAFVKNLASNPENTVIGLVRNVADTEARIAEWKTSNIHIIQADMTKWESLQVPVDPHRTRHSHC
jgi:hypothetical protein